MKLAQHIGLVVLALGLPTLTPSALHAQADMTLVPYMAEDYAYSIVGHDVLPGFEQPGFDDSAWETTGAGFGSTAGICPLNEPATRRSNWPLDTDLLLRRWVLVPEGVTEVRIRFAVDNDALIWINGEMVTDGTLIHEGCPSYDEFEIGVPGELLHPGPNLIAVRARDRGVSAFFDMTMVGVTADP